jgi:hypothetical protein
LHLHVASKSNFGILTLLSESLNYGKTLIYIKLFN